MNRRQFLTRIPMIGAAIVAAPAMAATMAVKPEFAMGGIITLGAPYMVGESAGETLLPTLQFSESEICRIFQVPPHMVGIPRTHYYTKFNTTPLLRGDAQPHKA